MICFFDSRFGQLEQSSWVQQKFLRHAQRGEAEGLIFDVKMIR